MVLYGNPKPGVPRAIYIYNEWRREIAGSQVTQVAGGGYN